MEGLFIEPINKVSEQGYDVPTPMEAAYGEYLETGDLEMYYMHYRLYEKKGLIYSEAQARDRDIISFLATSIAIRNAGGLR